MKVNTLLKVIKNTKTEAVESIIMSLEPDSRYSRIVLYQKMSGNKASLLRDKLSGGGDKQCSINIFNSFCEDYCVERMAGLQEEIIYRLKNVDNTLY